MAYYGPIKTTPTANTLPEWDSHKNMSGNSFLSGYTTTATSGATTTLTVSSSEQQFFTGSSNQTIVLPDVTTLALGQEYRIVNSGSGTLTVQSSGLNTISTIASASEGVFTCISLVGNTAAVWSSSVINSLPGINSITGDGLGAITGSVVKIHTNYGGGVGGTSQFVISGNTSTLQFWDGNGNLTIGQGSAGINLLTGPGYYNTSLGNSSFVSGSSNQLCTAIGNGALSGDSSGQQNTSIGAYSLVESNGGNNNCALGYYAGSNYTSTESNNIVIGANVTGTSGQSGEIWIGTGSSACYISGISQTLFVSGSPTPYLTLNDWSTGQLASPIPVSAATATGAFPSITVNGSAVQNTSPYPVLVNFNFDITVATGAQILIGVDSSNTPAAQAVTDTFSSTGLVSFSFCVPSLYFVQITATGMIAGNTTTFATQIG